MRRRRPDREQATLALDLGAELKMDGPRGVVPRAQALLDAL